MNISAYDDGSDFDASELVDDSDDQSDEEGSSLTGTLDFSLLDHLIFLTTQPHDIPYHELTMNT